MSSSVSLENSATGSFTDLIERFDVIRFGVLTFQFGLLVVLVRSYGIESPAFLRLLALAWGGFIVHHFLPRPIQLPFFACLSLGGMVWVLGAINAIYLVAAGSCLIGIAHLPIAFRLRILTLVVVAVGLFGMRGRFVAAPYPFSELIWPVLGSMFMFRMISYLYDLKHASAPFSFWRSISYFFLLPNVCFPLFPVVDYKTFCRSYFSEDPIIGYQKGLHWMLRGCIQLLAYRFIYQNLVLDPADVTNGPQALQLSVTTFLLYLRISGSFHVIIGMLRMFGFHLPETHHNFILSSSFTDHWRRINIYWRDFIQKCVFNPLYFPLRKRWGDTAGMIAATIVSFVLTWILHSYQWFWIRGSLELRWQDGLFWGSLGVLVLINMLWESRRGKRRTLKSAHRTVRDEIQRGVGVVLTFSAICLFWTIWSARSVAEAKLVLSHLFSFSPGYALILVSGALALGLSAVVLGRTKLDEKGGSRLAAKAPSSGQFWRTSGAAVATTLGLLFIAHNPAALSFMPAVAGAVDRLTDDALNARDTRELERGYYEDLASVSRFDGELASLYARQPVNWRGTEPATRRTEGFPPSELIPSNRVYYKGVMQGTNQFGMRDREYTLERLSNSYRIAMIGASHTKGSGVEDGETYENVVEDRLNGTELGTLVEILNFGNGGYGPLSKLAVLKDRAKRFKPDAAIFVAVDDESWMTDELANVVQKGIALPFDEIQDALDLAELEAGTPAVVTRNRMASESPRLVQWVYAEFVRICREADIEPILLVLPRPSAPANERDVMAVQARWAREAGFQVFDMDGIYDSVADQKLLQIAAWDDHPNARGHQMLAERLYPQIQALVTDALKDSPETH